MPAPSSPNHGVGAGGPPFTDPHPSQPLPAQPAASGPPAGATPGPGYYPGPLPPPVPYSTRPRRRLVLVVLAAGAIVVAMTAAIGYGVHRNGPGSAGTFTAATARAAIQGYLDALERGDREAIARNALCGIYDAVRDRRADQAVARLSSDAFRKQFSEATVTSVDKIVYWSTYQAQVLFSMRVTPAAGGPARDQVQGLAQLLFQRNQVLVCSYVLRTAGAY
ncbi:hypothetical protein [Mycobacterium sp.]|uniref:Rv0361 family membrane protein n=2 Tax=Mycobacterium sp. TaxID=1785 RepID=UPI0031D3FECE